MVTDSKMMKSSSNDDINIGFLLRIDAVNFDTTLFDADDISAIRGGSEALLVAPATIFDVLGNALTEALAMHVDVDKLFVAASFGLARITPAAATADAERQIDEAISRIIGGTGPEQANAARLSFIETGDVGIEPLMRGLLPHFGFAWGLVAETGNQLADMKQAEISVRRSQMCRLSVDIPPVGGLGVDVESDRPCHHDGVRPRNVRQIMPDIARTETPEQLSLSIALRRAAGRTARRGAFYRRICAHDNQFDHGFAHEFGELVERPPAAVAGQIAGKMAVIYLDANGIGAAVEQAVKDFASAADFANRLQTKRAEFLKDFLHWAAEQDSLILREPERAKIDGVARALPVLRMETLLWGADESMFVCPAWALEPVLCKLSELLEPAKWQLGEDEALAITHAVGVVVCSHKAPIRLAKHLAEALAENAKQFDRASNQWQFHISGSIDMPSRSLEQEREALYKIAAGPNQRDTFTLSLDGVASGLDLIAAIKGESGSRDVGIPRGKLSAILQDAMHGNPGVVAADLRALIDKGGYRDAGGKQISYESIFENSSLIADPANATCSYSPLITILELWPFVGLDLSKPSNAAAPEMTEAP